MEEKRYGRGVLAVLLGADTTGVAEPYRFAEGGLWFCLHWRTRVPGNDGDEGDYEQHPDRVAWEALTKEEQAAMTGCENPTLKADKDGAIQVAKDGTALIGNLPVSADEAKPLLPLPATAREIADFNRATDGAIAERFYHGSETEGWIAEQPPDVQALARMLLKDEPPEDDKVAVAESILTPGTSARTKAPVREDLLSPLIKTAMDECGSDASAAQVFTLLREWAAGKQRPLIGVTDDGIQWIDASDAARATSQKAIGQRMKRLRERPQDR